MSDLKIGFAMCGSFCTFEPALEQLEKLVQNGYQVQPVMSQIAYGSDTRFGKAEDFKQKIKTLCQKDIIHTVVAAEPIGPKKLVDLMVVCPCTGNTIAKIANGITDGAVTSKMQKKRDHLSEVLPKKTLYCNESF